MDHHTTRPEDRVPLHSKAAYSSGSFVLQMGNSSIQYMANLIFNIELGISLALIGLAMMLFRIIDALLDPLMGNISDNTRMKWGRRKPYIFAGAIMSGLTFPLIWLVPEDWGTAAVFAYFFITSVMFFISFTVFAVPWETLSAELSPDYHERTSVVGFRLLAQMVAISLMGWIYAITNLKVFGNPLTGMRWTGVAIGGLIILFGILPALFCKERFRETSSRQRKIGFFESLRMTFSNKPFLIVIGLLILMTLGLNLVVSLGQYLNIYYVFDGAKDKASLVQGYAETAKAITSFIVFPLAIWFGKRFGKRHLILVASFGTLVVSVSKWFLITPEHPNWQIVVGALIGLVLSPFWIGLVALLGDIADFDEFKFGARREGSYTAVYTWVFKFSLALTLYLGNLVIQSTGFNLELGGSQSLGTFFWMRVFLVGITCTAAIGCIWLIRRFPITESKAYEIRSELEGRRGVV